MIIFSNALFPNYIFCSSDWGFYSRKRFWPNTSTSLRKCPLQAKRLGHDHEILLHTCVYIRIVIVWNLIDFHLFEWRNFSSIYLSFPIVHLEKWKKSQSISSFLENSIPWNEIKPWRWHFGDILVRTKKFQSLL